MSSISVKHIATTSAGGAGTAMKRLNKALNQFADIDSEIATLYENKYSSGYLRYAVNHLPIAHKLVGNQLDRKFTPTWLPQISNTDFNSDIVHLHWIAGYLSPSTIEQIESPIVWTLHDMWPLTGGCHYAKNCDRYSQSCGHCPALDSTTQNDISSKQFRAYRDALSGKDIYYIAPSEWMAKKAEESSIVDDPIKTIPNCLDTEHFAPINQAEARNELSIPAEANVILTGGMNLEDHTKGGDLLVKAFHYLKDEINADETIVVTFGGDSLEDIPFETRSLGWVDYDRLPFVYSSADVMAVPSRYESFGQIATEASACGTPVVAFDTSGLSEIVIDGETGLLAKKFNSKAYSDNILELLSNSKMTKDLGESARKRAIASWSPRSVVEEYEYTYKSKV